MASCQTSLACNSLASRVDELCLASTTAPTPTDTHFAATQRGRDHLQTRVCDNVMLWHAVCTTLLVLHLFFHRCSSYGLCPFCAHEIWYLTSCIRSSVVENPAQVRIFHLSQVSTHLHTHTNHTSKLIHMDGTCGGGSYFYAKHTSLLGTCLS